MNCQYFTCLNQIFELNKIHVQFGTLMNNQLRTSKDSYQQNCGVKENMCSLFPAIIDFQSFFIYMFQHKPPGCYGDSRNQWENYYK